MIALLDANVLLALAWPNHQHHALAQAWFIGHADRGWATCSLTQLGFIRLSSNPSYTKSAVAPQEAASLLKRWTSLQNHQFWTSPPADDPAIYENALGHQQINDAWLVETALQNSGRLITLDTRLTTHAKQIGLVDVIDTTL